MDYWPKYETISHEFYWRFLFVLSDGTGEISATLYANSSKVVRAQLWHASTCELEIPKRRDFRILNAIEPCLCGLPIKSKNLCSNEAIIWEDTDLKPYRTEPGMVCFSQKFRLLRFWWCFRLISKRVYQKFQGIGLHLLLMLQYNLSQKNSHRL